MSATGDRFAPMPVRRLAAVLLILTVCGLTTWVPPLVGRTSDAADTDHAEESDVPAVSALPKPGPGPRLSAPVAGEPSAENAGRLLRPPNA